MIAADEWESGLWIRIDLIRIQIRFRIQAKTDLLKTISFSNFFEIEIWVKSNKKYQCYSLKIFSKSSLCFLYLFSGKIFLENNLKVHLSIEIS
jgi:hypothetical protein